MRYIFSLAGFIGVVLSLIGSIYAFQSNQTTTGVILLTNIIVYSSLIVLSILMDKTDELKKKCDLMDKYLSTKEDYLSFMESMEYSLIEENEDQNDFIEDYKITEVKETEIDIAIKKIKNKEYDNAYKILNDNANNGNIDAYAYLGYCLMLGYGCMADKNTAVKYFELAANAGIPNGKYLLGLSYLNGNGVERNKEKGKELIFSAAEMGSKKAIEYIKKYNI